MSKIVIALGGNALGKTPQDFRNNKNLIFELIEVGLTEVLPVKVLQSYGGFCNDVR